jgi:hypothetical protein
MDVILIYGLTALALFIISFVAKRRFGLLGLALSAGSILSVIWGYDAGLMAGALGFRSTPLTSSVISSLIILLPAVILLFHGYVYKTLLGRLVGALLFTLLALAFLVDPLGRIMMPSGIGRDVYNWLSANHEFILGSGLIVAVVDLFLTKPVQSSDKKREH